MIYQENTDIFADFPLFFLNELVQKGSFQPCLKKADVTQNFEKAQERQGQLQASQHFIKYLQTVRKTSI